MESVLEKIVGLDFTVVGNGNRWRYTEEHSSLILDLEEQVWFWNSKNMYHKTPLDYLVQIKGYSQDRAKKVLSDISGKSVIGKSVETRSGVKIVPNEALVDLFWKNGKKDREYWYKRCLTDRTIDLFKLGKFDSFYTIPIYVDGLFRNFQRRQDIPEKKIRPWYSGVGPLIFNSSILELVDTVYITEGPVDSILLVQNGFPAISQTGGAGVWLDAWSKYFLRTKRIYYIADSDEAGKRASIRVAGGLGNSRVKVVQFDGLGVRYDTVDFFRDGHTKDEFKDLVDKAKFSYEIKEK